MTRSISLFAFGSLFALACSGDDEPAVAEQTREGFCREWASRACSAEVVSVCQAEDASACRLTQADFCQELVPEGFVDDRASACLNAVRAAYVDADLTADELATVLRLGPPCDRLVRGPRREGDSCTTTADCDAPAGYSCVLKGAEGTCQIPRVVDPGLACDAAQETCTPGFYCNGENCVAGRDEGSDCFVHEECDQQTYCSTAGTCTERLELGEDCTSDFECESGICFAFDGERTCVDRVRLSPAEPLCDQLR